jgi:hypothetical protein
MKFNIKKLPRAIKESLYTYDSIYFIISYVLFIFMIIIYFYKLIMNI